jgi:molybdenum cofactor guanylyltransferase
MITERRIATGAMVLYLRDCPAGCLMNCYLLVGGKSRRMGSPKGELELDGRRFLDRVREAAAAAFDSVTAVQRPGGASIPEVRTIFESEHESSGAIFGLQRALEDAEARLWLLGVDYPLITSGFLRDLRSRFERSREPIFAPMSGGMPQMLCCGYDPALLGSVNARIAAGDFRMRSLLEEGARIVSEEEWRRSHSGEPLLNVNDPLTLELARKIHGEETHASR